MHLRNEEAGLDMLLGLLLQELPESILHEVAKVPELGVGLEEFLGFLEELGVDAYGSAEPSQGVLPLTSFARNYYIALSSQWR
jgi:hypothetical protein